MTYVQECLEKFQDLPSSLKERFGGAASFKLVKELEEKYGVSLSFLVVLLAIGELSGGDIYDYLRAKYKLTDARARALSEEIEGRLLNPIFQEMTDDTQSEPLNVENAKEQILQIFTENLVATLEGGDAASLQELNLLMFRIFQDDPMFEDRVVRLLYKNGEVLTAGKVRVEGNEVRPTIANWLKSFVAQRGSSLFSNLDLAEFISDNQDVKRLSPREQDRVRSLLKLYRNLVFFPESMEGVPMEEWEIFPIVRVKDDSLAIHDVLADENPIPPASRPAAEPAARPQTPEDVELAELMRTLSSYPPASLEHKAISQEISRRKSSRLKKTRSAGRRSDGARP